MKEERKNYILKVVNELQKNSIHEVIDVVELARSLGFTVLRLKREIEEKGLIYVNDSGKDMVRIIAYNSNLSEKENRFIIAHELGHFYLHSSINSFLQDGSFVYMYHNKNGNQEKQLEDEADFFAANLLLPKELFIEQYKSYGELATSQVAIDGLSNYFKVSQRCIRKRIKEVVDSSCE